MKTIIYYLGGCHEKEEDHCLYILVYKLQGVWFLASIRDF